MSNRGCTGQGVHAFSYRRSFAFIGGPGLVFILAGPEKEHIWPPMNAVKRR